MSTGGGERSKLWTWTTRRHKRSSPDDDEDGDFIINGLHKRPKFGARPEKDELVLDAYDKGAALRASPSVVALVSSYSSGEKQKQLFQCCGTIIECDCRNGKYFGTIITSATLLSGRKGARVRDDVKVTVYLSNGKKRKAKVLAHDLHYNLAVLEIKSKCLLSTAILRDLDISITLDPIEVDNREAGKKSFQLLPHRHLFKLTPGDKVVALGRYFIEPYELMVSPGQFSINRTKYECKELLRATCKITMCGIGGPLINRYGEVIGISFYSELSTPFMPINIVSKWWEHVKKYGEFCRPSYGMEVTTLFNAGLELLEMIIQKFPKVFGGVIVEQVTRGSSAHNAGILVDDVIVKCDGKTVQSELEFFETMLDKAGETVVLEVIRADDGGAHQLSIVVDKTLPEKFYCWRLQIGPLLTSNANAITNPYIYRLLA